MTQLRLPNLPEIDPAAQLAAARKLERLVAANRRSFKTQDYCRRRAAALRGLGK